MSHWHRRDPMNWDMDGDWDGRVIWSDIQQGFIRYLDRNGELPEPVAAPGATLVTWRNHRAPRTRHRPRTPR